jgi:hypothetical protein
MNGLLTNGRNWRFVRIEGDTLYHFDITLNAHLTALPILLYYLSCFACGDEVKCDLGQWPPTHVVDASTVCIFHLCKHF